MLARRDPSRQGKRHNAFSPLFAAPLGKGSVSPLKVGHVDVRRDCPSDDTALAVSVHDMKNAVAVVDLDWQRNENLSFQKIKRHVHSPSPNAMNNRASRRLARPLSKVKSICCVNGELNFRFRQTADLLRPRLTNVGNTTLSGASSAAPRRSAFASVTATPSRPANDNPVNDDWHPLEAA